jgi:hypothetical protein
VDVHCAEELSVKLEQYTLNSSGSVTVTGPVYKLARSLIPEGIVADTVPVGAPFTTSFPGHTSVAGVTLTQDVNGVLQLEISNHCLALGRLVRVRGWPSVSSTLHFPVTEIIGQDLVILGEDLPIYTVSPSLSPVVDIVYPSKDTGFSDRQERILSFGIGYAGGIATMESYYFTNLDSVQAYLDSSENRVLCADLLGRGYDICILDINLVSYQTVAPTSGEIGDLAQDFLDSLQPGQNLILADLVSHITAAGVTKIRTPLGVTYSIYTKDIFAPVTGTIVDTFKPFNSVTIYKVGSVVTSTAIV